MKSDTCPLDCPYLEVSTRGDYYPHGQEFRCKGKWLGFLRRKRTDCPMDEREEMPLFGGTDDSEK